MTDDPNFNMTEDPGTLPQIGDVVPTIKVIGVGGGGNNAINHMYKQHVPNISFVVCNTDAQALHNSPVPTKLLIGPTITKGLGAGNDPEKAKKAAEESVDEISKIFDENTQMVFITAGMGGGTGTGAAPVVAKIAKEKGVLTIGIVTIPFLFEGEKKILKAINGADEMSKYVDALLVINNERLTEIYQDLNFTEAFAKADDTLSTAASSISELINVKGYINLDFNDVNTTLKDGGVAIISRGYGEGENRVTKAIEDALKSPLLKNRDVEGSKKILFNIYFSPKAEKQFVMSEADELTQFVNRFAPELDVIWGVSFDESLGNKVRITLLASGFKVTLNDERGPHTGPKRITSPADSPATGRDRIAEEYGEDKIAKQQQEMARARFIILTPEQFDNDEVVNIFEKNPAFNRETKVKDAINAATSGKNSKEIPLPENINDERNITPISF